MAKILWPTLVVIGVLALLIIVLRFFRPQSPNHRLFTKNVTQEKDIEGYIRQLKQKEYEAWNQVMTVISDDESSGRPIQMSNMTKQDLYADEDIRDFAIPLTELQKAFFAFWKIPLQKIPSTREDGNRFIKAYKARLKTDGYEHRVRRWERLEILMARFYSDYSVDELNDKCADVGIKKNALELLLSQTMSMLSKGDLRWRGVGSESAYQLILKHLDANYPQLMLNQYKRVI